MVLLWAMSNIRLIHRADITRKAGSSLDADGERVISSSTVYEGLPCLVRARRATAAETEEYSASVSMYMMFVPPATELYPQDAIETLEYRNGEDVFPRTKFQVVSFNQGMRYGQANLREVR